MLVIGDKEVESDKLIVRDRGSKDTRKISQNDFIKEVKKKAADKS